MVSRFERFSFAISEIYRYLHRITSDEMQKYGLKGPYAIYLITMHRYPEGITAARLGELCSRNKADVSRAMAELEEKRLIIREGTSQTLYRARLKLTEDGLAAARQLQERARIAVDLGGKGLTEERRAVFYEALELIAENMQALSESGLPRD